VSSKTNLTVFYREPKESEIEGNRLFLHEHDGAWSVRFGPLVPEALRLWIGCASVTNLQRAIKRACQSWLMVSFEDIEDRTVSFTCARKDLQEVLNRLEEGCRLGRVADRLDLIDVEAA